MRAIDRFQAVMAVVFFIGTLVSAWRVAVADGGDIWYVPVIMALASAAMTVGALQHRKRRIDMKTNLMQLLRLVLMVLAVAGVIYAIEFMERGIAVWFWVALLGIGFVGLLYTFRLTQRRVARENRERQRLEKKRSRRSKR